MDRMTTAVINGVEMFFYYSMDVLFDVTEKFGSAQTALERIMQDDREGFAAFAWLAARLQNEAELVRRDQGQDKGVLLQAADITTRMSPYEYAQMRDAVVNAISIGYHRERPDDEDEEVDLVLQELEAKKGAAGV